MISIRSSAIMCLLLSCAGVLFLSILALLCFSNSESIEIPEHLKKSRALSGAIAALGYAIIACGCIYIIKVHKNPKTLKSLSSEKVVNDLDEKPTADITE